MGQALQKESIYDQGYRLNSGMYKIKTKEGKNYAVLHELGSATNV